MDSFIFLRFKTKILYACLLKDKIKANTAQLRWITIVSNIKCHHQGSLNLYYWCYITYIERMISIENQSLFIVVYLYKYIYISIFI